jgi:tRNA-modifying protein YgfZ
MTAPIRNTDRLFFDLSARVKLRITGADCIRFLNGQITNDIRKASQTDAIEACILNAKGKTDAHLFVHLNGDFFLIDADPALRPVLQARLERYVIADDVQIEDITLGYSIFHIIGDAPPTLAFQGDIISAERFGTSGHDIWCEARQRDQIAGELAKGFKYCDEKCAERLRIEQGIPRWGRELTPEIIPVEANLEQRCIDYEKGCYIGQETISRMKMSGQRNKQLCGLVSSTGAAFVPETRLMAGLEQKDVGWITSAAHSEGREIALGYVKRGFNSVGTKVEALSGENARVGAEVVTLPFSH